jgi:hypothetical protein
MKHSIINYLNLLIIVYLLIPKSSLANDTLKIDLRKPKSLIQMSLLDMPYLEKGIETTNNGDEKLTLGNLIRSYENPSMHLSLDITNSFYSATHYSISKALKTKETFGSIMLENTVISAFDLLSFYAPLGLGWLHEEYHRASLTQYGIHSFNGMNTFPLGESTVSVSGMSDEDLQQIKGNSQQDFIRLQAAGIEGENALLRRLQKENFYYQQGLNHIPLYWISTINSTFYVLLCSSEEGNTLTDEILEKENDNVLERDFTGLDFTAWTYELFRGDKTYAEERGQHPSGVGIDRYIKPNDLTQEELDYLRKVGNYQFLNMLSPTMFGFSSIDLKRSGLDWFRFNFAFRSNLTNFGMKNGLDLMFDYKNSYYFLGLHSYANYVRNFWGIELALIDEPLKLKTHKVLLSPSVLIFNQPKNQEFKTENGELGGMASLQLNYFLSNKWAVNLNISHKTEGWVMSAPTIDPYSSIRFGFRYQIF